MKVKILSLVLVAFSLLLIPNANSFYKPLHTYNPGDPQWQWQWQEEQHQLQLLLREIDELENLIWIIAPPEVYRVFRPVLEGAKRNIIRIILQHPERYQINPPKTSPSQTPVKKPSSSRSGPVKIAVIDMFSDPNGLDNTVHHGDIVTNTIRDSMSKAGKVEGREYEIIRINLANYRIHTGTNPIYTKDGNVVIDGIIYHDYRNLSSNGLQHDYRAIGVVISTYGLIKALEDAKRAGADVINMSNGASDEMGKSMALKNEFAKLKEAGITVVAAAGNEGKYGASYPARYKSVIGVGAPAEYSNYGPGVDFIANGNYKGYQGTSFAAPRVAAAVALLLMQGVQPEDIRSQLSALADNGYLSDEIFASLGRGYFGSQPVVPSRGIGYWEPLPVLPAPGYIGL